MQRLIARWYLLLLALVIALLVSAATLFRFEHGHLTRIETHYYVASGQVLVDSAPSVLTTLSPLTSSADLAARAPIIAQYCTQTGLLNRIANSAGVKPTSLTLEAAIGSAKASGKGATNFVSHSAAGTGKNLILLRATGVSPQIQVTTQASSEALARRLTFATMTWMQTTLIRLVNSQPASAHALKIGNELPRAATSTTTTTTAAATAGTGSRKKGNAATKTAGGGSPLNPAAELRAIVLRRLGSVNASKVTETPKKTEPIGFGVGAFVVLVIGILILDNWLTSRRRGVVEVERRAPVSE